MRATGVALAILIACACAAPAAAPSPTPTETPTPSPTPVEAQALAGLQTDEIKVFARSSAVRSVTKAGEPLGAAVLMIAVDEAFAALPNAFDGFVNGFTSGAGGALITQ